MVGRKRREIKHLERLLTKHGYRGLARLLGYQTHSTLYWSIKHQAVGLSLAHKIHRRFGIALEELGH